MHHSVAVFPSKDPPCKQMCDLATTLPPCSHIWILSLILTVHYDTSETVGGGDIPPQGIGRQGGERRKGSWVGGRSTTKRLCLLRQKWFEGPWCSTFLHKWGGQAFYITLAPCLCWAHGQAGYWWIQPEASKLNSCLFQSNFYKVTPAGVFFILKQEGYFNRD